MRIIAGIHKGMRFDAPQGTTTRPTVDRVRESIFNTLYSLGGCVEAYVLDGFAGSGALGLEALSRGAVLVTFFERDRKSFSVCKKNIKSLKIEQNKYALYNRDIFKASLTSIHHPLNLVFFDPPYAYQPKTIFELIDSLKTSGLLSKNAIIVYEHASTCNNEVSTLCSQYVLEIRQAKQFGTTQVSFLKGD